jgi:cell division protein ZipA
MSIFHKRLSNAAQGPIIFSIANILNPGTFDLNNMEAFTTLGVSLFLPLPSPINNIDAFEQMLEVAQQIRDALGGELKDDQRNGMTAQTIEHYRQRILDFELLRLKTAGARA